MYNQKELAEKTAAALFKKPVNHIDFKDLYEEGELILSYARFRSIKANTFKDFKSLHTLSIMDTKIETLEADCFKGLKNVRTLDIHSCNDLQAIEPNAFNGLNKVESIFLNDCNLDVANMEPDTFKGLPKLEELRMRKCSDWCSENEWLAKASKRKNLFAHLKHLKRIDFSRTAIHCVDEGFFAGLSQLESVELEQNSMEKIDINGFTGGLTSLKHFCSIYNRLDTVNLQAFSNLPKLTSVSLSSNKIKSLTNERSDSPIGAFTSLDTLCLKDNSLTELRQGVFQQMSALECLSLTNNSISFIEANTFLLLAHLTHLKLSKNKLIEIGVDMFKGMSQLQSLDVSYNLVALIQPTSFDELVKLKKLNLSCNKLAQVEASLFSKLSDLEELLLDGNEFDAKLVNVPLKKKTAPIANLNMNKKRRLV